MRATGALILRSIGTCFLLATLSFSASGQNPNTRPARPGTINYVEGQASVDGQPLSPNSVGSAELEKGQVLTTQAGKVEVLLTPGVSSGG
jgi:hypothetical protein